MKDSITFIIPSINRKTLKRTIDSLYSQTNQNWFAIIIYDGVDPDYDYSSEKIKVIKINKTGEFGRNHGQSGLVRNYGLDICETNWVGFLDDDDTIEPKYVETLLSKYKELDLVIWRMKYYKRDLIIPRLNDSRLYFGNVGISVSFKRKFLDEGLRFRNNRDGEDFDIVMEILNKTNNFIVTNEIFYKVGF